MTDAQLIEGILNREQKCFKELVDKYQLLVLNTCNSFLHDKNNAEDIAQEVFIEVFLSINKFKSEAKLSTWLYRIAVNKSLNFIRDNKNRSLVKSIENYFSGEQKSELQIPDNNSIYFDIDDSHTEKIELLHKAIDSLSDKQKTALTLSKFEKLSYAQIAEVMDLSLSSVEGLIHRAKINLQKKILNYYKKKSR